MHRKLLTFLILLLLLCVGHSFSVMAADKGFPTESTISYKSDSWWVVKYGGKTDRYYKTLGQALAWTAMNPDTYSGSSASNKIMISNVGSKHGDPSDASKYFDNANKTTLDGWYTGTVEFNNTYIEIYNQIRYDGPADEIKLPANLLLHNSTLKVYRNILFNVGLSTGILLDGSTLDTGGSRVFEVEYTPSTGLSGEHNSAVLLTNNGKLVGHTFMDIRYNANSASAKGIATGVTVNGGQIDLKSINLMCKTKGNYLFNDTIFKGNGKKNAAIALAVLKSSDIVTIHNDENPNATNGLFAPGYVSGQALHNWGKVSISTLELVLFKDYAKYPTVAEYLSNPDKYFCNVPIRNKGELNVKNIQISNADSGGGVINSSPANDNNVIVFAVDDINPGQSDNLKMTLPSKITTGTNDITGLNLGVITYSYNTSFSVSDNDCSTMSKDNTNSNFYTLYPQNYSEESVYTTFVSDDSSTSSQIPTNLSNYFDNNKLTVKVHTDGNVGVKTNQLYYPKAGGSTGGGGSTDPNKDKVTIYYNGTAKKVDTIEDALVYISANASSYAGSSIDNSILIQSEAENPPNPSDTSFSVNTLKDMYIVLRDESLKERGSIPSRASDVDSYNTNIGIYAHKLYKKHVFDNSILRIDTDMYFNTNYEEAFQFDNGSELHETNKFVMSFVGTPSNNARCILRFNSGSKATLSGHVFFNLFNTWGNTTAIRAEGSGVNVGVAYMDVDYVSNYNPTESNKYMRALWATNNSLIAVSKLITHQSNIHLIISEVANRANISLGDVKLYEFTPSKYEKKLSDWSGNYGNDYTDACFLCYSGTFRLTLLTVSSVSGSWPSEPRMIFAFKHDSSYLYNGVEDCLPAKIYAGTGVSIPSGAFGIASQTNAITFRFEGPEVTNTTNKYYTLKDNQATSKDNLICKYTLYAEYETAYGSVLEDNLTSVINNGPVIIQVNRAGAGLFPIKSPSNARAVILGSEATITYNGNIVNQVSLDDALTYIADHISSYSGSTASNPVSIHMSNNSTPNKPSNTVKTDKTITNCYIKISGTGDFGASGRNYIEVDSKSSADINVEYVHHIYKTYYFKDSSTVVWDNDFHIYGHNGWTFSLESGSTMDIGDNMLDICTYPDSDTFAEATVLYVTDNSTIKGETGSMLRITPFGANNTSVTCIKAGYSSKVSLPTVLVDGIQTVSDAPYLTEVLSSFNYVNTTIDKLIIDGSAKINSTLYQANYGNTTIKTIVYNNFGSQMLSRTEQETKDYSSLNSIDNVGPKHVPIFAYSGNINIYNINFRDASYMWKPNAYFAYGRIGLPATISTSFDRSTVAWNPLIFYAPSATNMYYSTISDVEERDVPDWKVCCDRAGTLFTYTASPYASNTTIKDVKTYIGKYNNRLIYQGAAVPESSLLRVGDPSNSILAPYADGMKVSQDSSYGTYVTRSDGTFYPLAGIRELGAIMDYTNYVKSSTSNVTIHLGRNLYNRDSAINHNGNEVPVEGEYVTCNIYTPRSGNARLRIEDGSTGATPRWTLKYSNPYYDNNNYYDNGGAASIWHLYNDTEVQAKINISTDGSMEAIRIEDNSSKNIKLGIATVDVYDDPCITSELLTIGGDFNNGVNIKTMLVNNLSGAIQTRDMVQNVTNSYSGYIDTVSMHTKNININKVEATYSFTDTNYKRSALTLFDFNDLNIGSININYPTYNKNPNTFQDQTAIMTYVGAGRAGRTVIGDVSIYRPYKLAQESYYINNDKQHVKCSYTVIDQVVTDSVQPIRFTGDFNITNNSNTSPTYIGVCTGSPARFEVTDLSVPSYISLGFPKIPGYSNVLKTPYTGLNWFISTRGYITLDTEKGYSRSNVQPFFTANNSSGDVWDDANWANLLQNYNDKETYISFAPYAIKGKSAIYLDDIGYLKDSSNRNRTFYNKDCRAGVPADKETLTFTVDNVIVIPNEELTFKQTRLEVDLSPIKTLYFEGCFSLVENNKSQQHTFKGSSSNRPELRYRRQSPSGYIFNHFNANRGDSFVLRDINTVAEHRPGCAYKTSASLVTGYNVTIQDSNATTNDNNVTLESNLIRSSNGLVMLRTLLDGFHDNQNTMLFIPVNTVITTMQINDCTSNSAEFLKATDNSTIHNISISSVNFDNSRFIGGFNFGQQDNTTVTLKSINITNPKDNLMWGTSPAQYLVFGSDTHMNITNFVLPSAIIGQNTLTLRGYSPLMLDGVIGFGETIQSNSGSYTSTNPCIKLKEAFDPEISTICLSSKEYNGIYVIPNSKLNSGYYGIYDFRDDDYSNKTLYARRSALLSPNDTIATSTGKTDYRLKPKFYTCNGHPHTIYFGNSYNFSSGKVYNTFMGEYYPNVRESAIASGDNSTEHRLLSDVTEDIFDNGTILCIGSGSKVIGYKADGSSPVAATQRQWTVYDPISMGWHTSSVRKLPNTLGQHRSDSDASKCSLEHLTVNTYAGRVSSSNYSTVNANIAFHTKALISNCNIVSGTNTNPSKCIPVVSFTYDADVYNTAVSGWDELEVSNYNNVVNGTTINSNSTAFLLTPKYTGQAAPSNTLGDHYTFTNVDVYGMEAAISDISGIYAHNYNSAGGMHVDIPNTLTINSCNFRDVPTPLQLRHIRDIDLLNTDIVFSQSFVRNTNGRAARPMFDVSTGYYGSIFNINNVEIRTTSTSVTPKYYNILGSVDHNGGQLMNYNIQDLYIEGIEANAAVYLDSKPKIKSLTDISIERCNFDNCIYMDDITTINNTKDINVDGLNVINSDVNHVVGMESMEDATLLFNHGVTTDSRIHNNFFDLTAGINKVSMEYCDIRNNMFGPDMMNSYAKEFIITDSEFKNNNISDSLLSMTSGNLYVHDSEFSYNYGNLGASFLASTNVNIDSSIFRDFSSPLKASLVKASNKITLKDSNFEGLELGSGDAVIKAYSSTKTTPTIEAEYCSFSNIVGNSNFGSHKILYSNNVYTTQNEIYNNTIGNAVTATEYADLDSDVYNDSTFKKNVVNIQTKQPSYIYFCDFSNVTSAQNSIEAYDNVAVAQNIFRGGMGNGRIHIVAVGSNANHTKNFAAGKEDEDGTPILESVSAPVWSSGSLKLNDNYDMDMQGKYSVVYGNEWYNTITSSDKPFIIVDSTSSNLLPFAVTGNKWSNTTGPICKEVTGNAASTGDYSNIFSHNAILNANAEETLATLFVWVGADYVYDSNYFYDCTVTAPSGSTATDYTKIPECKMRANVDEIKSLIAIRSYKNTDVCKSVFDNCNAVAITRYIGTSNKSVYEYRYTNAKLSIDDNVFKDMYSKTLINIIGANDTAEQISNNKFVECAGAINMSPGVAVDCNYNTFNDHTGTIFRYVESFIPSSHTAKLSIDHCIIDGFKEGSVRENSLQYPIQGPAIIKFAGAKTNRPGQSGYKGHQPNLSMSNNAFQHIDVSGCDDGILASIMYAKVTQSYDDYIDIDIDANAIWGHVNTYDMSHCDITEVNTHNNWFITDWGAVDDNLPGQDTTGFYTQDGLTSYVFDGNMLEDVSMCGFSYFERAHIKFKNSTIKHNFLDNGYCCANNSYIVSENNQNWDTNGNVSSYKLYDNSVLFSSKDEIEEPSSNALMYETSAKPRSRDAYNMATVWLQNSHIYIDGSSMSKKYRIDSIYDDSNESNSGITVVVPNGTSLSEKENQTTIHAPNKGGNRKLVVGYGTYAPSSSKYGETLTTATFGNFLNYSLVPEKDYTAHMWIPYLETDAFYSTCGYNMNTTNHMHSNENAYKISEVKPDAEEPYTGIYLYESNFINSRTGFTYPNVAYAMIDYDSSYPEIRVYKSHLTKSLGDYVDVKLNGSSGDKFTVQLNNYSIYGAGFYDRKDTAFYQHKFNNIQLNIVGPGTLEVLTDNPRPGTAWFYHTGNENVTLQDVKCRGSNLGDTSLLYDDTDNYLTLQGVTFEDLNMRDANGRAIFSRRSSINSTTYDDTLDFVTLESHGYINAHCIQSYNTYAHSCQEALLVRTTEGKNLTSRFTDTKLVGNHDFVFNQTKNKDIIVQTLTSEDNGYMFGFVKDSAGTLTADTVTSCYNNYGIPFVTKDTDVRLGTSSNVDVNRCFGSGLVDCVGGSLNVENLTYTDSYLYRLGPVLIHMQKAKAGNSVKIANTKVSGYNYVPESMFLIKASLNSNNKTTDVMSFDNSSVTNLEGHLLTLDGALLASNDNFSNNKALDRDLIEVNYYGSGDDNGVFLTNTQIKSNRIVYSTYARDIPDTTNASESYITEKGLPLNQQFLLTERYGATLNELARPIFDDKNPKAGEIMTKKSFDCGLTFNTGLSDVGLGENTYVTMVSIKDDYNIGNKNLSTPSTYSNIDIAASNDSPMDYLRLVIPDNQPEKMYVPGRVIYNVYDGNAITQYTKKTHTLASPKYTVDIEPTNDKLLIISGNYGIDFSSDVEDVLHMPSTIWDIPYGKTVRIPLKHPYANDYEFDYWLDPETGMKYYPGQFTVIKKNLHLKAVYKTRTTGTYSVTYRSFNEIDPSVLPSGVSGLEYGYTYTVPPAGTFGQQSADGLSLIGYEYYDPDTDSVLILPGTSTFKVKYDTVLVAVYNGTAQNSQLFPYNVNTYTPIKTVINRQEVNEIDASVVVTSEIDPKYWVRNVTKEIAYRTIQECVDAADSGDIIRLMEDIAPAESVTIVNKDLYFEGRDPYEAEKADSNFDRFRKANVTNWYINGTSKVTLGTNLDLANNNIHIDSKAQVINESDSILTDFTIAPRTASTPGALVCASFINGMYINFHPEAGLSAAQMKSYRNTTKFITVPDITDSDVTENDRDNRIINLAFMILDDTFVNHPYIWRQIYNSETKERYVTVSNYTITYKWTDGSGANQSYTDTKIVTDNTKVDIWNGDKVYEQEHANEEFSGVWLWGEAPVPAGKPYSFHHVSEDIVLNAKYNPFGKKTLFFNSGSKDEARHTQRARIPYVTLAEDAVDVNIHEAVEFDTNVTVKNKTNIFRTNGKLNNGYLFSHYELCDADGNALSGNTVVFDEFNWNTDTNAWERLPDTMNNSDFVMNRNYTMKAFYVLDKNNDGIPDAMQGEAYVYITANRVDSNSALYTKDYPNGVFVGTNFTDVETETFANKTWYKYRLYPAKNGEIKYHIPSGSLKATEEATESIPYTGWSYSIYNLTGTTPTKSKTNAINMSDNLVIKDNTKVFLTPYNYKNPHSIRYQGDLNFMSSKPETRDGLMEGQGVYYIALNKTTVSGTSIISDGITTTISPAGNWNYMTLQFNVPVTINGTTKKLWKLSEIPNNYLAHNNTMITVPANADPLFTMPDKDVVVTITLPKTYNSTPNTSDNFAAGNR